MAIRDSVESGDQGYRDLLREDRREHIDPNALVEYSSAFAATHALLFPGDFSLEDSIRSLRGVGPTRLFVDAQYSDNVVRSITAAGVKLDTVFCSTSSPLFQKDANGEPHRLRRLLPATIADHIVLKENRGGSRVFLPNGDVVEAGAHVSGTQTSVGVGDCFDVLWLLALPDENPFRRLRRAAVHAGIYASTRSDQKVREDIGRALEADEALVTLKAQRISWEDRPDKHIYIAGPDFPEVDTRLLDSVESALRYHNFTPHRPVQEVGLGSRSMAPGSRRSIYDSDMRLIERSSAMVAIPIGGDPGTMAELGVASTLGIPVALLDPDRQIDNLFVEHASRRLCRTVADAVDAVFEFTSRSV
jgi:nucleoside 2-deoxyribosyltransferase